MGGIVAGIAYYFVFFRPVESWLLGPWGTLIESMSGGHHQPMAIVKKQLKNLARASVYLLPWVLAIAGWLELCRRWLKPKRSTAATLLIRYAIPVTIFAFLSHQYFFPYFFYPVVAGLVLYAAFHFREDLNLETQTLSGLALLGILPLALSIGTNFPDILIHSAINLAPGWLFLYILCTLIQPRDPARVLLVAFPLFVFPMFLNAYLLQSDPLTGMSPLLVQSETSNLPKLKGLLIESSLKAFLEQSNAILQSHDFRPGDEIFCPNKLLVAGLLYAVDAVTPGLPYTADALPDNAKLLNIFLKSNKLPRFFIATFSANNKRMPAEIDQVLTENGIAFPAQFEYLGSVPNPLGMPEGKTEYWKCTNRRTHY